MKNLIGVNLNSYLGHHDAVWEHLPRTPIRHIEANGELHDPDALARKLDKSGLALSSAVVRLKLDDPGVVAAFEAQVPAAARFGVTKLFTSVKAGEMPKAQAYATLRRLGDAAQKLGVFLCLETHPDLMTNGETARATMEGVAHPHVRMNFDTANLYFYTRGINAVDELRKVIEFVGAVHLKETDGGYQSWHFPALGEGVVDFPKVFELLAERDFHGPYNLELEGVKGEQIDLDGIRRRIDRSAAYLQEIGVL